MDNIKKRLKETLKQDKGVDIDTQLATNCLRYLTERIEFTPSMHEESYFQELRQKYTPINPDTTPNGELTVGGGAQTDGIPAPRQVLFDPGNLWLKWPKSRSIGSGLNNMGNTCFLNSVIQCLTYTPPLFNYLFSDHHRSSCAVQGFCTMCELHRHVTRVMGSSGNPIKPIPIVQNLKVFAKHLRYGRQEDAHEFLRYFIDSLQKVCLHGYPAKLDIYSKHTTVIHQIFGGYHRSQVKCSQCHRTSNTFDPLLDISVDIKGCSSLIQALQRSIKPDLLDEENKYACPFCKKLTKASKQLTIHTLPNVLTIQLKRFEYNSIFGGKINKMVSYPCYLDMRPYMSEPQGPHEWYQLYAVLVHFGFSCHSGHYYCYVKNSNGIWYSLNDSMVSQVSFNTVQTQEAYLLFYIKDDEYVKHSNVPSSFTSENKPAANNQKIEGKLSNGTNIKNILNCDKTGTPYVIPCAKPTGIVNPSPQKIPPPPAPPTTSCTTTSLSSDSSTVSTSIATSGSATPQTTTSQTSPFIKPLSVVTPTHGTPSGPSPSAPPRFIPRSVGKWKSTMAPSPSPKQTVSDLFNSNPKLKKPQVALVHPLTHKPTTKPTAYVPPSPQQKLKDSDTEQPRPADKLPPPQTDSSSPWNVSESTSEETFGPRLPPGFIQGSSGNWTVTSLRGGVTPEGENEKGHRSRHDEEVDSDSGNDVEHKMEDGKKYRSKKRRRERSSSCSRDETEGKKKRKSSNVKRRRKRKEGKHSRHHKHKVVSEDEEYRNRRTGVEKSKKHNSKGKGEHSDSDDRHKHSKTKRKHTSKEETRKDVPELKWDEKLHPQHLFHKEDKKSKKILDYIENGDQLEQQVKTWDGKVNSSIDFTATTTGKEKKQYGRDEWDLEIDRGKVKKSKKNHSESDWGKNKFQIHQNKKIWQKKNSFSKNK